MEQLEDIKIYLNRLLSKSGAMKPFIITTIVFTIISLDSYFEVMSIFNTKE